jgi:ketosteroid isomerase-like protein
MKKYAYILLAAVLLSACTGTFTRQEVPETITDGLVDEEEQLNEMLQTDKAFSAASEKNGMNKAFLEYAADDAVLLRPGYMPIVEADVIKFIKAQEDTSFTMTWIPSGADIASSADLGYTYGVYKVVTADTTLTGTYLNVWKKQPDGQWKFVIDSGNAGTEKQGM